MNLIKLLVLSTLVTLLFACKGASVPEDTNNEEEQNQEPNGEQTEEQEEPNEEEEEEEIDLTSGECPHSGNIIYSLNNPDSWPAEARKLIDEAMSEAVWYYNCYADLSHNITVNYKPSVPTAEAHVNGTMSFGSNTYYMHVITAMHEVGHTMGVSFYPWLELIDGDMRWTGEEVKKFIESIPEEQRAPGTGARNYITADRLHFWPYGLNQRTEAEDENNVIHEWSLINHVKIVAAMQVDKNTFLGR